MQGTVWNVSLLIIVFWCFCSACPCHCRPWTARPRA